MIELFCEQWDLGARLNIVGSHLIVGRPTETGFSCYFPDLPGRPKNDESTSRSGQEKT